jgi:hypothetical protein
MLTINNALAAFDAAASPKGAKPHYSSSSAPAEGRPIEGAEIGLFIGEVAATVMDVAGRVIPYAGLALLVAKVGLNIYKGREQHLAAICGVATAIYARIMLYELAVILASASGKPVMPNAALQELQCSIAVGIVSCVWACKAFNEPATTWATIVGKVGARFFAKQTDKKWALLEKACVPTLQLGQDFNSWLNFLTGLRASTESAAGAGAIKH